MNENFYKKLMEQSPSGYAYHKIICDKTGRPCDYVFIEVNKVFEKLTGMKGTDIVGKPVTKVIPGIKTAKFDWIARYGEIALKDEKKEFEQFSERLNKWYRVNAYSPGKGYFVTIFTDITNERKQIQTLKKLFAMSEELLQWTGKENDYQKITESILKISDAKFSVFNLYDEDGKQYTTMAMAGDGGIIKKAMDMMGIKLYGKKWIHDPVRAEKIKDKTVTHFPALCDLTGDVISKPVTALLTKAFALGEVVLIKITNNNIMLGDFTLIMPKGKIFDKDNYIGIFAGQMGLRIERERTEEKLKSSEEHLNTLISNTPAVIYAYTIDMDSIPNLTYINHNITAILGYKPEKFIGKLKFWTNCVHPDDMQKIAEKLSGREMLNEYRIKDNKGEYHWIHDKQKVYKKGNGNIEIIGAWWDITERKQMEQELIKNKERQASILNQSPIAIEFYDSDGCLSNVNDACLKLFGIINPEEIKGFKLFDDPNINEEIKHRLHNNESIKIDCKFDFEKVKELGLYATSKSGVIDLEMFISTLLNDHITEGYIVQIQDVTEQKQAKEKILHLSYHDQLTGLYNRRYYEMEMKRLNDKEHIPLTLIMADVNGLKLTNDVFGHGLGDELLIKVAGILKAACRKEDIVFRIGGDEFVILLPETDAESAEIMISRINTAIKNEKFQHVILSVSMGYAVKQNASDDITEIFMQAEDNMYRQKLSESSSMRSKTIDLIMNSLYEKNKKEMLHSKRVGELCSAIAEKMGFTKDEIDEVKTAGLMHDIGKIGIPESILNKPNKLDTDEWNEVERHLEIGYRILGSVHEFSQIANYILEHHEKWDGTGYPKKLKGEEISLQARIIAVADCYDAMTTDRSYRKALSEDVAAAEIKKCSGTQFDPEVVNIFLEKVLGTVRE
ncbi:MAG: HD domain-containing phosphohydrolase [Eubacteriales bacterium]